MAYEAGSVVFSFEADTTKLNATLKTVEQSLKKVNSKGVSGNPYLSEQHKDMLKIISASRQTIKAKEMMNKLDRMNLQYNTANVQEIIKQDRIQKEQAQLQNVRHQKQMQQIGVAAGAVAATVKAMQIGFNAYKKSFESINKIVTGFANTFTKAMNISGKFVYSLSGIKTEVNILKSVFNYLGQEIQKAFSVEKIIDFAKQCAELGSDLTEVQNVVDTIFKSDASAVNEWSSSVTKQYGMSALSAKEYASTMGAIFNSAGLNSDVIKTMSVNLAELTADMSSLYNYDYDDMFEKIRAGMTGQVRPLASLGVSLHVATLQEYLFAKGINVAFSELTSAQKQLVRYNYLIDSTRAAQGDFAKTFYTWANQIRYLKEQIKAIMTNIGQIVIAALNPILITINKMIEVVAVGVQTLHDKIIAVLGDGAFSEATKSIDLSDVFDDTTESINEMNKALKRTTSSYDELHKLSDNGDSTSAVADLSNLMSPNDYKGELSEVAKAYLLEIEDLIRKIKDAWKKADFTDLGSILGKKINEGIGWINEKLPVLYNTAKKVGLSLATFLNGLIGEIDFYKLGQDFIGGAKAWLYGLREFLLTFNFEQLGLKLRDGLSGIFSDGQDGMSFIEIFGQNLALTLNNIAKTLSGFADYVTFTQIGEKINMGINEFIACIRPDKIGAALQETIISVAKLVSKIFQPDTFKDLGKKVGEALKKAFSKDEHTIFTWIGETIGNVLQSLNSFIAGIFEDESLSTELKTGLQTLFAVIKNSIDWKMLFDNIIELHSIIQTYFESAFSAVD